MNTRKYTLNPGKVEKCPNCGNDTEFTVHSDYCAEDCCEVWAVCKCGYEPTIEAYGRFEDVWGGTDKRMATWALSCWNAAIQELREADHPQERSEG